MSNTAQTILPPDYHTHTLLCKHAGGMPIDYVRAALQRGLVEIACTDHFPATGQYDPLHRMEDGPFALYRAAVQEAQNVEGCAVLFGVEADYQEGELAFLRKRLDSAPLDLVLGSIHTGDFWEYNRAPRRSEPDQAYIANEWQTYFRTMERMAETGLFDVAAHFDLPKRGGRYPGAREVRECVEPALDALARAGMAIEINTAGNYHLGSEPYPSAQILAWANERGIPITFGSDAHTPDHIGRDFEKAMELARMAGYTQSARYRGRRRALVPF